MLPQRSCQTSFPPKVDVQGESSLTSNVATTQIVEIICKTSLQFRSFTFNRGLEPQTTSSASVSAPLAKALTVMLQRDAASSQCCVDSAWPGQSDGNDQLHKLEHDLLCSHNTSKKKSYGFDCSDVSFPSNHCGAVHRVRYCSTSQLAATQTSKSTTAAPHPSCNNMSRQGRVTFKPLYCLLDGTLGVIQHCLHDLLGQHTVGKSFCACTASCWTAGTQKIGSMQVLHFVIVPAEQGLPRLSRPSQRWT